MWCYPDGQVEIFTIDGGYHLFRDGYWWNDEDRIWAPSVGAMTGIPYRATRAELARRAEWLGMPIVTHPGSSCGTARPPEGAREKTGRMPVHHGALPSSGWPSRLVVYATGPAPPFASSFGVRLRKRPRSARAKSFL